MNFHFKTKSYPMAIGIVAFLSIMFRYPKRYS